jgi:hypothetical protein
MKIINRIEGKPFIFRREKEEFDAIIAAIGYREYAEILKVDKTRFEDLKVCR